MERLKEEVSPQEIIGSITPFDFQKLRKLGFANAVSHVWSSLEPFYAHLQLALDKQGPYGRFNDHTLLHHLRVFQEALRHVAQTGKTDINTGLKVLLAVAFHDIGGIWGRDNHPQHSAEIARRKIWNILPSDLSEIIKAIQIDGLKPDELADNTPFPRLAAAVNLADDLDWGRQRLPRPEDQDPTYLAQDPHARLNFATAKVQIVKDGIYPTIEWWLSADQQLVSDLSQYSEMLSEFNGQKFPLIAQSWFSLYPKSSQLTILATDGKESKPLLVVARMPNGNLEISS